MFRRDPDTRKRVRAGLGIADSTFVAVGVGVLERQQKRVDWLLDEFAGFAGGADGNVKLLLVGLRTPDTAAVEEHAARTCGDKALLLADQPRDAMPGLLSASDVFVHACLHEMMPVAFLEAAAAELPIVSHGRPVMQWIAGEGRIDVDMQREGELARALRELHNNAHRCRKLGGAARANVLQTFDKTHVTEQLVAMYGRIIGEEGKQT